MPSGHDVPFICAGVASPSGLNILPNRDSVKHDFLYDISDKLKPMIKLEYLRVFATVAETRALNEAADRLGRTPSAISMTLKQIEDALGGPLFEGERKVALTPLGAFALRHAQTAVAGHNAATAAIRRFARGEEGEVRIAAVPSAATRLLPGAGTGGTGATGALDGA